MTFQHNGAYFVQGSLNRLNLLDHVNAIGIFLRHPFDTLDMTSGTG
jgi:hypothetical protein